jgi:L-Lysine epsilon oxidase N-terminal/L-lysine epsilon oxidase C-terminal domain/von Willebrand factor type A domain
MAITTIKIHPAIGIARLGNSPGDFFIGPEIPLQKPSPSGGSFKDTQCKVKRQAARFRLFAYDENGVLVQEITNADANITWAVHLANKKAIRNNPGSASDLTIDPGSKNLNGPDQQQVFDGGKIKFQGQSPVTVPLGEIRTDHESRLLVLGGAGKSASVTGDPISWWYESSNWYDDVSDGPVTATVVLLSNNQNIPVTGAWVICPPPKFSPLTDSIITLYDRIFEMAVEQTWLAGPAKPSYTNDIYPILQRAFNTQYVANVGTVHNWTEPVYDPMVISHIFSNLVNSGGDMPALNANGGGNQPLMQFQYDNMTQWNAGNYFQDWPGAAPLPGNVITPHGMDQASLENCVGAAFYPGIEAGGKDIGKQPIIDPSIYIGSSDPMRLNHSVLSPGDITAYMALPWQADFQACTGGPPYWWPVPRPVEVTPQGTTSIVQWDRDIPTGDKMVTDWNLQGFVLKDGGNLVEVEKCGSSFVQLLTPFLYFQDVPQGPSGMSRKLALPVVFEVSSASAITFQVLGPGLPVNTRLTVYPPAYAKAGPTVGNSVAFARIWVVYETGAVGEMLTDQVTVTNINTSQTWSIPITATTAARQTAAAALVLDHSGSMADDRGDGLSKYQSLMDAASILVDVMVQGDALGIVRFNQTADKLLDVLPLGDPTDVYDTSRTNAKNIIKGGQLSPGGSTSIGNGIDLGRQILDATGSTYDIRAMMVLTDGMENEPKWIADVASEIDSKTYSVGLGKPENISVPALETISGNNGGYCLITGAVSNDNQFILMKYFIQILAGINNTEIVLDPEGQLFPGNQQAIPFQLTESDAGADIILLTPYPNAVNFRLRSPIGSIIEPWQATSGSGILYVLSQNVSYYRIVLPWLSEPGRPQQAGTWEALLSIGKPNQQGNQGSSREAWTRTHFKGTASNALLEQYGTTARDVRTLPYNLVVHSYSDLSLRATLIQSGYEPGATIKIHATVAMAGMPAVDGISCWVEIKRPDSTQNIINLVADISGQFNASFSTSLPGVYTCRIRARGRSGKGYPFNREQTLTAVVWKGGDNQGGPSSGQNNPIIDWLCKKDERICQLLNCFLASNGTISPQLEKKLQEYGMNFEKFKNCLKKYCGEIPCRKTDER